MSEVGFIVIFRFTLGDSISNERGIFMSDFWDYRGWERREENNNWQDIQGENLEYRADGLMNLAMNNGLEDDAIEKTIVYLASANDINRQIERLPELLHGLLALGDCYLKQGKAEEVRTVAIEAQKIALETFNDKARAYAIHMQGYNSFVTKNYAEAAAFAVNAGEIYKESAIYDDACDVFLAAGRLFRWNGERTKSIDAFERALDVARIENNLENIVHSKAWLAFVQARANRVVDYETLSASLSQTKSQMQMAKSKLGTTRRYELANAWNNIEKNPAEALQCFDHWLEQARFNKVINDSIEAMLGRQYCLARLFADDEFVKAALSIVATLEDIESTVDPLEAITPLSGFYFANEQFVEAELIWVRGKAIAEKNSATAETLSFYDQMIALCIAHYAEPERALTALENSLPKTAARPLSFEFEYALAKSYAQNNRNTESLIVVDRALENINDESRGELEYAELHALKCELLAKQGNLPAAKSEAKLSFDAYLQLNEFEKAKRLNAMYLLPQPGDANPETGAITLGNWG